MTAKLALLSEWWDPTCKRFSRQVGLIIYVCRFGNSENLAGCLWLLLRFAASRDTYNCISTSVLAVTHMHLLTLLKLARKWNQTSAPSRISMDFPWFLRWFFSTHGLNKLPQIWWVKPTLWSHRADTEHMEHLSDALQKSWKRSDERRWNIHYMHIYVCIQCIYTYVYMCMYMCIYICVCMYIYVYIHAYSYHIYIYSQSGVDGTWKLQKKH